MRWVAAIGGENTPSSTMSLRAEGLSRLSRYIVGRTHAKDSPASRNAPSTSALATKLGSAQGAGRLALASFSTNARTPAATVACAARRACATMASDGPVGICSTTASTPTLAARKASRSSRSASTVSTPLTDDHTVWARLRTMARTAKPRASAARTTAPPWTPLAR